MIKFGDKFVTKFCELLCHQIYSQPDRKIYIVIFDHFPKVDGKRVVATEVLQNISRWETPFESDTATYSLFHESKKKQKKTWI